MQKDYFMESLALPFPPVLLSLIREFVGPLPIIPYRSMKKGFSERAMYWNNCEIYWYLRNDLLKQHPRDIFIAFVSVDTKVFSDRKEDQEDMSKWKKDGAYIAYPSFSEARTTEPTDPSSNDDSQTYQRNKLYFLKAWPFLPSSWRNYPIAFRISILRFAYFGGVTAYNTPLGLENMKSTFLNWHQPKKRYVHFGQVIELDSQVYKNLLNFT
jgi:hypothetical protein